jgi:superfamily II DNA or RNA helicase
MIEKRITYQLLETGELVLTPLERTNLSLPEHSTTIDIDLEGEPFHAQWSGRSRQLRGDVLAERLQDYGQEGGLVRLRLVDQTYRLTLLPPGTPLQVGQVMRAPPAPARTAAAKKARRRATVDRQFHADEEYDWGAGVTRTIGFLTEARMLVGEQLKAAGFDPLEIVELRRQGEELATLDDFEELLAVDVANVDRMPHQEAVARHALSRLRGRAVLADEVGLGKTIEAGLAVKELTLRGLAKRVLVLCPAPLRDQWREEMSHKFDLAFDVSYGGAEIADQDKLILSHRLAVMNIDKLTKKPWDIVIVDEAHRAAGEGAHKTRELITRLTTACRYAFFLTATPVQNNLLELYRLVELLRPATFTSQREFERRYITGNDPRRPKDPAALRRLISDVMIRTTRARAGLNRVVRRPQDVPIDLGAPERELYALSTDLLRNIMRHPSDTMRRRHLALRLTASPFSMGTTALRIAERHSDERVRRVLNEIGHRAMDIKESARENKALDITSNWLREHGRVLIFTQHTDTITGLLRRMEREGLTARSFHGDMSATERAATIAAFKSGEAPIMISNDSGAEGQNLQFCNCVLNYDLPWNPMRIEQRIGRVDRLTQPCDEVFIANLYSRGTIDENVYRLLAEKLRMFELLFGQVTTILGELDDAKTVKFETRVLEALFAESDSKMGGLLAELGTELADARERASSLIAADSGLSSWMSSALEHRKDLPKAGSADLMPEVSDRARMRQRRVQTWIRSAIGALGAHLLHDTGEHEGAFITVQFDEEFEEELGGRTLMHLAFDRYGLEHHPDAELCAVGSPVFEELLGLLRRRGDLHATVPVIPDDPGPTPYRHNASTTLVRRRLIPSGKWNGHATFRATVGEAETTEHVIIAAHNENAEIKLPRRALQDGEVLPPAFGDPFEVVEAFERAAAKQLEALRRNRARQVESEQARELARIRGGYTAQIAEASPEEKVRLRRALRSEEGRLSRQPDVRARAKLLALTLDENDWLVEETWSGPDGVEGTLTYEWGLSEAPPVESAVSLQPIRVLALCPGAHWVDESELARCNSCGIDSCIACGDDAVFTDCPICQEPTCGKCRRITGGLCQRCGSPERAPELDEQYSIAWRLNRGATLLVGTRVAELARPSQSVPSLVVPDEDVDDRSRIRIRSYAVHNRLPADSGLVLRDLSHRPPSRDPGRLHLRGSTTVQIELSQADDVAASDVDPVAVADLPEHEAPAVDAEHDLALVSLLAKLRRDDPPPAPPTVVVTRRSTFIDTYLEAERLVEEVSTVADDGTLATLDEHTASLEWQGQSLDEATLVEATLEEVRVSLARRNDAVLVSVHVDGQPDVGQWIALPEGACAANQLAWFDRLQSLGTPGGRVGQPTNEISSIQGPFPSPAECQLVDLTVKPVAELAIIDFDFDLIPADSASLSALGVHGNTAPTPLPGLLPAELNRALLEHAQRSFTAIVANGLEIHETWRGHGTATHHYRIFDGIPIAPKLDDVGVRETNFGVCGHGHFYAAGTSALCASCQTRSCRACDDIDHQASITCPSCSASVCRRCLSGEHAVCTVRCLVCDDRACPDCGRDPQVLVCSICDRTVCANCRTGELCCACDQLAPAAENQLGTLPAELAGAGAVVLIGSDKDATTVLLNRGGAVEQAVIRNGSVDRWVAFGRTALDSAYRLRLSASRALNMQVIPVLEVPGADTPIDVPHLVVHSKRMFCPAWSVTELDASGRSAAPLDAAEGDLVQLVADEFPAATQLPTALAATPTHVERAITPLRQPPTANLAIWWHRFGDDVAITADGIIERTIDGSTVGETVTAWTQHDTAPTWVTDAWNPPPAVPAFAVADTAEAAVVSIASLVALGVRVGGQSTWYTISPSPQAAAVTALARWMGVGDADEVGAFTDPTKVRLSTVTNATSFRRSVRPVGRVQPSALSEHPAITLDALNAWMPTRQVLIPNFDALPHQLRTLLAQQLETARSRTTLVIGAHVEELVTVEGAHVLHEVDLASGETDARRFDSATGHPADSGVIDREGHFSLTSARCHYCDGLICPVCIDRLVSCDCCQVVICLRCVHQESTDLRFCSACADLRRPNRGEARQHGRLLSTRHMLIGIDSQRVVVVEHAKQGWTRHGDNGEKSLIANPSVARFLSQRIAGNATAT